MKRIMTLLACAVFCQTLGALASTKTLSKEEQKAASPITDNGVGDETNDLIREDI